MNQKEKIGRSAYFWKVVAILAALPLVGFVLTGNASLGFQWGATFASVAAAMMSVAGMMFGGGMMFSAKRRGERGDLAMTACRLGVVLGLILQVLPLAMVLATAWVVGDSQEFAAQLAQHGAAIDGDFAIGALLGSASVGMLTVAFTGGLTLGALVLARRFSPHLGVTQ